MCATPAFRCEKCSSDNGLIEEVQTDVTETAVVLELSDCGTAAYDNVCSEGGTVSGYRCVDCFRVITNDDGNPILDAKELYEWLKIRGMLVGPDGFIIAP